MNPRFLPRIAIICAALPATIAMAADIVVAPAPPDEGATTIYRHVMPDGRIVYSDKVIKGIQLDETITIEPPIKGNLWTTESGPRPVIAPQTERTRVNKVNTIPASGQRKTIDDATSDVIRAEMLLEDARQRQQNGVEPLPGERTGVVSGNTRLNDAYHRRQKQLAQDVADAKAALEQAKKERNALRHSR